MVPFSVRNLRVSWDSWWSSFCLRCVGWAWIPSVDGCRGRLWLTDDGLGHGQRDLVAAGEHEDRRDGDQRDRSQHPERLLEAAGERGGCGVAGVKQRRAVAGGDA